MRRTGIVVGLLVAGAVVWAASGSGSWLRFQHRLQLAAKDWSRTATIVEIEGAEPFAMFVDPTDQTISPTLWRWGIWEPNETHWFIRSLRPGDVVVDVGANIGYYTLLGARLVGDAGRVYAFEPDPAAFAILERNVRLNGLENVVLEQKAVSNEAGSIQLFLAATNKGDHRIYDVEGEERQAIDVEAVALDAYFEGVEDAVDFVKVDAQGAEGVILDGMLGLIGKSDDLVMAFEYSPQSLMGTGYTGNHLLKTFRGFGLTMFDLGIGDRVRSRMQPVGAAQLHRRYPPTRPLYSNLLLIRGRPQLLAEVVGGGTGD